MGRRCTICQELRRAHRFIFSKIDPYISDIPMHYITMDSIYLKPTSRWGSNYAVVSRDVSSCWWCPVIWMAHRNEWPRKFRVWLTRLRSDPNFRKLNSVVNFVGLDPAGEWGPFTADLYEIENEFSIRFMHAPGDHDKRACAYHEVAVLHFTKRMKASMMEVNVPLDYYEEVGNSVVQLMNALPPAREVTSQKGSAPTAEELATKREVMREESWHFLDHYVNAGTLAYVVLPKEKASDLASTHADMMVCVGMRQGCPLWEHPVNGSLRTSKHYTTIPYAPGVNWQTLLRIPAGKVNNRSRKKIPDPPTEQDVVLDITGLSDWVDTRAADPAVDVVQYGGVLGPNPQRIWLHNVETGVYTTPDGTPCEAPPAGTDATTVAIRVHNPEGAASDGGMSARERERAITAIRTAPRSLEGREVWQRFTTAPDRGSKEHRGMITETWGGRSKPFWHVKWDDGTDSDYDLDEVVHYLVDGFTSEYGSSPRCRSVESDRVIVPEAENANRNWAPPEPMRPNPSMGIGATDDDLGRGIDASKPDYGDPYSRVRGRVTIHTPRPVLFSEAHVGKRNTPVHTVRANETFRKIGRLHHVPDGLHRPWMYWLGHYFGTNAERAPRGGLGFKFLSPWEAGGNDALLPVGQKLPLPAGKSWQQWIHAYQRDAEMSGHERRSMRVVRTTLLVTVDDEVQAARVFKNGTAYVGLSDDHPGDPWAAEGIVDRIFCKVRKVHSKAFKAYMGDRISAKQLAELTDGTGHIKEPKGKNAWKQIQLRPDREEWVAAREKEQTKIKSKGVLSEYMTLAQRIAFGCQVMRPVPVKEIWEIKKTASQEYDRHKCRMVLEGAPYNMPKGTYGETFASTPTMEATRMLLFLVVQLVLIHEIGDVDNAYLESWMDVRWRVPVQMAEGLRRFFFHEPSEEHPGGWTEEMHPVCIKGLYGHPSGGALWGKEKNKILTNPMFNFVGTKPPSVEGYDGAPEIIKSGALFNTEDPTKKDHGVERDAQDAHADGVVEWRSKAARYDASLFIYAYTDTENVTYRGWMVTYVDDLDLGVEIRTMSTYIWGVLGARLGITRGDPGGMLGMRRRRGDDGSLTVDMEGYIEKMYIEFKHLCGDKIPKTPMPPGTYLSMEGITEVKETVPAKELEKRIKIFLKVLGMLLWLTRTVLLEASTAVNMLCRHSHGPSEEAMKLLMGVVAYAYGVRRIGITFRKVENPRLIAFYDASNKADPADGDRAQAGYIITIGDGPIAWRSFRVQHVGLSAQHNEYSSLAVTCQTVAWLRLLMEDMGLTPELEDSLTLTADPQNDVRGPPDTAWDFGNMGWDGGPTPVFGDNNAAITLGGSDLLTVQNRFYSRLAHYAKVAVERGMVSALYIETARNIADGFTKIVDQPTFERHFPQIRGMVEMMDLDFARSRGGTPGVPRTPTEVEPEPELEARLRREEEKKSGSG
jgi:hypothetical protein